MTSEHTPRHERPRWLVVLAVVAAIALLVLVVAMVLGGGKHGPGRHTQGTGDLGQLEGQRR
ncbi:hypothetical protein [Nocardioides sp. InS609-2]|uniref:hypothetical protein n=1 Tax=Nocardioides sp. InS609-2 TaxID=2760705 RepID=UPI0020BD56F2|nr:hypothetical protein [Nocardioides sp. InS609-2]